MVSAASELSPRHRDAPKVDRDWLVPGKQVWVVDDPELAEMTVTAQRVPGSVAVWHPRMAQQCGHKCTITSTNVLKSYCWVHHPSLGTWPWPFSALSRPQQTLALPVLPGFCSTLSSDDL
eukprot:TRINITY_DN22322_c0_g1_i1.p1 TRINITY_DN22322_c0_g1~~TRINITY_DN22322_c0_g1_i1.p1  ORF type:complete len:120 (+),score=7.58 TRINITY_DN22322_c0_g1_i1:154-513(+)